MQPNLQRTVEDAQTVQFVIEQWVIDSADKWAFVLQAAGGSICGQQRSTSWSAPEHGTSHPESPPASCSHVGALRQGQNSQQQNRS